MGIESTSEANAAPARLDPIFPRFADGGENSENQLIAFIAYGLYEQAKREWVAEFRNREGRLPGDPDLRTYESSWTKSRLEATRAAAVQLVAAYADSIVGETELAVTHRLLRGSLWRSMGHWLFSAAVFTCLLVALFILLSRLNIDPVKSIQQLATP